MTKRNTIETIANLSSAELAEAVVIGAVHFKTQALRILVNSFIVVLSITGFANAIIASMVFKTSTAYITL